MNISKISILALFFYIFARTVSASENAVPGELVVKIKPQAVEKMQIQGALIHSLQKRLGENEVIDFVPLKTDASYQRVKLASRDSVNHAISVLKENPDVEIAEPNFIYHISRIADFTPNDPEFKNQWAIHNPIQIGVDIGVIPAWSGGFTGDRKVVVAVIDTGIDYNHPDLKNNIFINKNEIAGDGIDNDGNGFIDDIHGWNFITNTGDASDDEDHGTHCSGIIGAAGNNGIGVAGVNWNVSILPVKFIDQTGAGSLDKAIEAINYARRMKVQVMSNSWGGGDASESLRQVIQDVKKAGILFVAAAGNEKKDNDESPSYPASYDETNVVSVGALNTNGALAWFSNFGKKSVHVAAPGVSILSTVRGGSYRAESGTSMACPYVAGVAALVLGAHPELKPEELRTRLMDTAMPLASLPSRIISGGVINAWNAIRNLKPFHPKIPDVDSTDWTTASMDPMQTEHPYQNDAHVSFKVSHPGAKFLRIRFERIGVELNQDFVRIRDKQGNLVQEITGSYMYLVSDAIVGDEATVELVSDSESVGFGFTIDEFYYTSH